MGKRGLAVIFLSVGCPVANAYVPRLNQLAEKYQPQGVRFVGVNANPQDSVEAVKKHARDYKIGFPVLKDRTQEIAQALGAVRTPQVFLIDSDAVLRYRGRIDDQYGVGFRKPKATRADLAIAIDECLAGKPVTVTVTAVAGCLIDREAAPAAVPITYCNQVARLMQSRCQACHRDDGVAPFGLMNYDQVKAWSKTIKEAVVRRRMPPWHADSRYGKFTNDRSLKPDEIDTLVAWVDSGAPRGNERDLPPPARFPKSWTIGEPDTVITMPTEFEVPAEGVLPYKEFVVETGFKEDVWVQRAEARPGCKAVHHILVYILEKGKPIYDARGNTTVLCGTAPGDMPAIFPPGTAKKIQAGARLLFEVHYTPNGKTDRDRSSIGLIFAKRPPRQEVKTNILARLNIRIPPNEPSHREEQTFVFPNNIRVLSFMPHMHLRGKSWEYRLIHPDGRTETLLSVPRFDFNWQSIYRFADPPLIPRGTRLQCIAHWDNSKDNPGNPDPAKTVTYGLQTWEEMMNGWMDYVVEE